MAAGTLIVEAVAEPAGAVVAATMAFVVFSLFVVISGLSCHSETQTAFNRNILHDKNQVLLNGLALLFIFLPTELGFLQRGLGLTSLTVTSGCSASAYPSSCLSSTRSSRSSCAAAAGTMRQLLPLQCPPRYEHPGGCLFLGFRRCHARLRRNVQGLAIDRHSIERGGGISPAPP